MTLSKQAPFALDTTKTVSAPAVVTHSWRFGDLSATELLPILQRYLYAQDATIPWQLVWLNNDSQPVIGVLPKVSWVVYPKQSPALPHTPTLYHIVKTDRDTLHSMPSTTADKSYQAWMDELIAYGQQQVHHEHFSTVNPTIKHKKPNYYHGLMGFIGYDIAAHELSPTAAIQYAKQPAAMLGHYDVYLTTSGDTDANSHSSAHWQLHSVAAHSSTKSDGATFSKRIICKLIAHLDVLNQQLSNHDIYPLKKPSKPRAPLPLTAKWQPNDYQHAFLQTQKYLVQGDCYQINLTQVWQGQCKYSKSHPTTASLIEHLPALQHNTQAPFAGYLAVNAVNHDTSPSTFHTDFELLSCSPELFFTFKKDTSTGKHHIITKPIKGTAPRGNNSQQDLKFKQQLINSDKDRSENVMIVDLLRNDLGKYAKTGSVTVPTLFAIESFSNVHHMVSTITAQLKENTHPLAVLFGSLPAGSITGTPKKRAVEIISELEVAPRGAYCGTLGYMNFDGSGQWNVLIRTLQASTLAHGKQDIRLWAGGGITIASNLEAEYQECLDKVGNLLDILSKKQ